MPVNLDRVDRLAAAVAGIYREAETALIIATRDRLNAGLDRTTWQRDKLAQLATYRRAAQAIANRAAVAGDDAIVKAIGAGYRAGDHDALVELAKLHAPHLPTPGRAVTAGERNAQLAVQALARAAVREFEPLHAGILPNALNAYRHAIAGAAARRLAGVTSTRDAAQAAWAALVKQGIVGYTDTAGRRWQLHTYVEMATRAAVTRAAVQGQVDRFSAAGVRLVAGDDVAGECKRCRPYEHQVLALWGATGRLPFAAPDGSTVWVDVVATLDEARLAGFLHPNCRHTIRQFIPGRSILLHQGRTADPEGEAARDRQRAMERTVRYWREQEAAALSPEARRGAAAKAAEWERQIGAHVAAHGLKRLHYRETIGAGFIPPAGRIDDAARLLGIPA